MVGGCVWTRVWLVRGWVCVRVAQGSACCRRWHVSCSMYSDWSKARHARACSSVDECVQVQLSLCVHRYAWRRCGRRQRCFGSLPHYPRLLQLLLSSVIRALAVWLGQAVFACVRSTFTCDKCLSAGQLTSMRCPYSFGIAPRGQRLGRLVAASSAVLYLFSSLSVFSLTSVHSIVTLTYSPCWDSDPQGVRPTTEVDQLSTTRRLNVDEVSAECRRNVDYVSSKRRPRAKVC